MRIRIVLDPKGMARVNEAASDFRDDIVEAVADDVRRRAPVLTGALRASVRTTKGKIWVGTDHWIYPEYGTEHQVAQPYIRPSVYQRRTP